SSRPARIRAWSSAILSETVLEPNLKTDFVAIDSTLGRGNRKQGALSAPLTTAASQRQLVQEPAPTALHATSLIAGHRSMLFACGDYPVRILAGGRSGAHAPRCLPGRLEEVLPLLGEVLVVLHYHVSARVPEELGDLGEPHTLFQRVRRVGVSVGVGDHPLK